MTNRDRPAVSNDFPLQAAENEGMPSRPDFEETTSSSISSRRRARKLSPGSMRDKTASCVPLPAKEEPTRLRKKKKNALARLTFGLIVVAGIIASIAFPVFAQDGTGPVPDNAEARHYGGGWDCDLGFREDGAECLALYIPDNAYATRRKFGSGWACSRGYQEISGASCEATRVPKNAHLRTAGYDWQCDHGYRQDRETCVPIDIPEHGYLTEESGSHWACDRGFTVLIDASDGPGWRCEWSFEAADNTCMPITLPTNAHLDRSGNRWHCDRNFQLSEGVCVLGR